jgi:hypothetical protein
LAERWEMPVGVADKIFKRATRAGSNLNHWRCLGYGPVFAKLGPGVRAPARVARLRLCRQRQRECVIRCSVVAGCSVLSSRTSTHRLSPCGTRIGWPPGRSPSFLDE